MRRNIAISFFILVSVYNINSADISEYPMELAAEIKIGNKEAELGWNEQLAERTGTSSQYFTFTSDNKMYVCDSFNGRLNVYDAYFNFIKSIYAKYGVSAAFRLYIDRKENIISLSSPSGIVKVDSTGKLIYQIRYNSLPDDVKGKKEYFILAEDILYYDRNGKIVLLDEKGKTRKEDETNNFIEQLNEKSLNSINIKEASEIRNIIKEKTRAFVENKKLVMDNEILLTANFKKQKEYSKFIKSLRIVEYKDKYSDIFNKVSSGAQLIGYDEDKNSYWEGRALKPYIKVGLLQPVVLVYDKYGEILDCFYGLWDYRSMAVAPNGDVYFREMSPKGDTYHFMKITRRW